VCAADEPLLDGTNPVPDDYFTASSEYNTGFPAHEARLSRPGVWLATQAEIDAVSPAMFLQASSHKNHIFKFLTKHIYSSACRIIIRPKDKLSKGIIYHI